MLQKETKNPTIDMAKLQIKSEKPLLLEDFFRGRGAILTPHGLSVIGGNKRQKVKILKFRMWFKYGLKAQKLLTQGIARKQHALKGQKLLAQGIALGIMAISKAPCKGNSFIYCLKF